MLAGLFVVLIGSVIWMLYTWPKLQADELLFQIRFLEGTGKNMTEKYVREALIPSLLVWAAAVGSMAALRRFGKDRGHRLPAVFCLVALLGALGITGYAFA